MRTVCEAVCCWWSCVILGCGAGAEQLCGGCKELPQMQTPFRHLCEACARPCHICSGVTLHPLCPESGTIRATSRVSQAGVTVGLLPPSPSSCLPRLIHPTQSCKVSSGMTSCKVRLRTRFRPPSPRAPLQTSTPTPRVSPSPGCRCRLQCRKRVKMVRILVR